MILQMNNADRGFGESLRIFREGRGMGRKDFSQYLAGYGFVIGDTQIYHVEIGRKVSQSLVLAMMYHDLINVVLRQPVSGIFRLPGCLSRDVVVSSDVDTKGEEDND